MAVTGQRREPVRLAPRSPQNDEGPTPYVQGRVSESWRRFWVTDPGDAQRSFCVYATPSLYPLCLPTMPTLNAGSVPLTSQARSGQIPGQCARCHLPWYDSRVIASGESSRFRGFSL